MLPIIRLEQSLLDLSSEGVGKLREVLGEFEKLWVPHIRIEEENFTAEKLQMVAGMKEQANLFSLPQFLNIFFSGKDKPGYQKE